MNKGDIIDERVLHSPTPPYMSMPTSPSAGMPLTAHTTGGGPPPPTTTMPAMHYHHVAPHSMGPASVPGSLLVGTCHPVCAHPDHDHAATAAHAQGLGRRAPYVASRANVVPLPLLHRHPAMIECPACKEVGPTMTRHKAGAGAHGMAVMFFFTTVIFAFIPYAFDTFKDVRHKCMRCGQSLATNHFGGGTQAHLM